MPEKSIFKKVANYKNLYLYQKADTLVLLTDIFCKRFLPAYGDRTVDQMNMAARSGKQNIVEGCEAAMTSTETELKLVNVGRSSFQELREDYEDYLKKKFCNDANTLRQFSRIWSDGSFDDLPEGETRWRVSLIADAANRAIDLMSTLWTRANRLLDACNHDFATYARQITSDDSSSFH